MLKNYQIKNIIKKENIQNYFNYNQEKNYLIKNIIKYFSKNKFSYFDITNKKVIIINPIGKSEIFNRKKINEYKYVSNKYIYIPSFKYINNNLYNEYFTNSIIVTKKYNNKFKFICNKLNILTDDINFIMGVIIFIRQFCDVKLNYYHNIIEIIFHLNNNKILNSITINEKYKKNTQQIKYNKCLLSVYYYKSIIFNEKYSVNPSCFKININNF